MARVTTTLLLLLTAGLAALAQAPAGKVELPAPRPEPTAPRIVLGQRTGEAVTSRKGLAHTTPGVVDVAQPRPDTVVITMTGLAAAGGLPCEESASSVIFDVCQHFRIATDRPARVLAEAQLVGLLRGSRDGAGVACTDPAEAVITVGDAPPLLAIGFPPRSHSGGESRFISDKLEPTEVILPAGEYSLMQRFAVRCSHPKKPFHKNVMTAAFGSDSTRVPEWLVLLDPSREVPKGKPLGFVVTLRVEAVK